MSIEVRTSYTFNGDFALDRTAEKAVGRAADFSGCGMPEGRRDLGWVVKSEWEAQKFKRALDKMGLRANIKHHE